MKDNNYLAMLTLHAKQVEIWADTLWLEIKNNKKDVKFTNCFISLIDSVRKFNKYIRKNITEYETHENIAASISKVNELIANSTQTDADNFINAIVFLANSSELVNKETAPKDLNEKLPLISDINDKLLAMDLKSLQRTHKQIINLPIK